MTETSPDHPAPPVLIEVDPERSTVRCTDGVGLAIGDASGSWTLMAVIRTAGGPAAVLEDFGRVDGPMARCQIDQEPVLLTKTAEPVDVDPTTLYRGHRLEDVLASAQDLLAAELLIGDDDPTYPEVAACLSPIGPVPTHTFLGTRTNPDKIPFGFGGANALVDPTALDPTVGPIRAAGRHLDGLVGGWLPVLRWVYPADDPGTWTELIAFAPHRTELANPRLQPVWFRLARVVDGSLATVRHVDSYLPAPPRSEDAPAAGFYTELMSVRDDLVQTFAPAMTVTLPEPWLADLSRHSLVRTMITRVDDYPQYGVVDRNYGGSEHDGFQDTFTAEVTAALDWGLHDHTRAIADNYLTHFVHDDGALHYRGAQTGQYGRMLTVMAHLARLTHDHTLIIRHRRRLDAIADLLISAWREARRLDPDDPAHGVIHGWCEADSCLDPDPVRYHRPYLSNSAEAVRGLGDLGVVLRDLGPTSADDQLVLPGQTLVDAAAGIRADLDRAVRRSLHLDLDPPWLAAIAGEPVPFHEVVPNDPDHPLMRSYRANAELLFSGILDEELVRSIVDYRSAHHDLVLGVPVAYGSGQGPGPGAVVGELAGFLSYGHGYGLVQHGFARELVLELYALAAHQYTRGTWTAPETRSIDPAVAAAPYCVPAQLAVPLLLRWLLVFEDPASDAVSLCRAAPRHWFVDGATVAAERVPTRWGRLGFSITVDADDQGHPLVVVTLDPPERSSPARILVHLRLPDHRRVVRLDTDATADAVIIDAETIMITDADGPVRLVVHGS